MSYYKKYVKSRFKNVNKFLNKKLANLGFVSKRKIAIAIARQYVELENEAKNTSDSEWRMRHWYAQSELNYLCKVLKIKPMHRSELGEGTSEIY